ncbi:UDP-N-acetylglucosamine 2-epimerase (non-hydrolysing) [Permianibacter aggregans]|uniref:UDP-N-acetylglucosamine 2-epimerase (Non-hydrolysing) n=2 Tax=Permianibacter aggregans TaxID=1510150 RepID=A0A4R6UXT1_9GAMM|nr:UDP-N-acetylglucosamine 2-epimerase (non-hydrolysing) [Permianibacter aggregans]
MIYLVAGARPNFMKIAPIIRAIQKHQNELSYKLIHTDQHYDKAMSQVFFEELGIPEPDFHLGCGGGTHAVQTAKIMVEFEKVCVAERPDCLLVVGDVNSTLACSIVSKKLGIRVAHVEAGLRSGDMSMPEEVNRIVTDSISDWFFVTEPSGEANLLAEGKPRENVFHVGHVMVDNLYYQMARLDAVADKLETTALKRKLGKYGVVTLHRPATVDNPVLLKSVCQVLDECAETLPLVFPVHPRTRNSLNRMDFKFSEYVHLIEPQSYMAFLNLWKDAQLVLTDSGGLQEETTAAGVSCLTLRDNTERPITVEQGTNTVVGTDCDNIRSHFRRVLASETQGAKPELWDGQSSDRIVQHLIRLI